MKVKYMDKALNKRLMLFLLCPAIITGCTLTAPPIPTTSTPTQSPTPTPVSGWQTITTGLEQRTLYPNDDEFSQIVMFRIDPATYTFRAHYRPQAPLRIGEWRDTLPGAAVIINANFFSQDNQALGLLITDGVRHGSSYTDRGGTFAVANSTPLIRSNVFEPYQGEAYEQAVQAFPMLVYNGDSIYSRSNDRQANRRTAIGIDTQGRVVIMVTPLLGLTLTRLSAYLADSDLDLANAFALDGGGSTMIDVPAAQYRITSFDPVPTVLAVYPR